jgi:hypothetical protein
VLLPLEAFFEGSPDNQTSSVHPSKNHHTGHLCTSLSVKAAWYMVISCAPVPQAHDIVLVLASWMNELSDGV